MLSERVGRTVRRVVLADEAFVAHLIDRGTPEPYARLFLGSFQAARRGEFDLTDSTLAQLNGRPPSTVRGFLTSAADAKAR